MMNLEYLDNDELRNLFLKNFKHCGPVNTHTRSTYINFLKNKLNQKNYENPSKLKAANHCLFYI